MIRWDTVLSSVKLLEAGVEEEEDGQGNISITHLTLMTCSGTLTSMPKTGMPTTGGSSRTVCGPNSRGRGATSATSRAALGPACLMTCLMTWRRCSQLTGSPSGLRAGFRAQPNSSAGP